MLPLRFREIQKEAFSTKANTSVNSVLVQQPQFSLDDRQELTDYSVNAATSSKVPIAPKNISSIRNNSKNRASKQPQSKLKKSKDTVMHDVSDGFLSREAALHDDPSPEVVESELSPKSPEVSQQEKFVDPTPKFKTFSDLSLTESDEDALIEYLLTQEVPVPLQTILGLSTNFIRKFIVAIKNYRHRSAGPQAKVSTNMIVEHPHLPEISPTTPYPRELSVEHQQLLRCPWESGPLAYITAYVSGTSIPDVLIDTGSQINIITLEWAQKLSLDLKPVVKVVSGAATPTTLFPYLTMFVITINNVEYGVKAYVSTANLPVEVP